MKRINLSSIDSRTKLAATLILASVASLAIGLFVVVSALTDDPVKLPHQGSIDEIVNDGTSVSSASGWSSRADGSVLPTGPAPVRMQIDRVFIDAPVVPMGFEEGTNIPAVPGRADQVAWYTFRSAPGLNNNAVFSGHVDWQTDKGDPIPGVFYRLRELQIGDPITITLEDGSALEYRVTGNVATKYDDPNVVRSMEFTSKDVLTLITCGGTWVKDASYDTGGNYSHRIIVRAERVTDDGAATLTQ